MCSIFMGPFSCISLTDWEMQNSFDSCWPSLKELPSWNSKIIQTCKDRKFYIPYPSARLINENPLMKDCSRSGGGKHRECFKICISSEALVDVGMPWIRW